MNTPFYNLLLASHGALAWIAAALALAAIGTAFEWPQWGRRLNERLFVPAFRVSIAAQVLLGVLLHLRFSPFTAGVRANVEVVWRDPTLRYWNLVHPLVGLLAVAATVVGPIYAHRADTAEARRRRTRGWLIVAAAVTIAAVPWNS